MALNLLQITQEVMGRLAKNQPTAVASSTDGNAIQCKSLLNAMVDDLITRQYWQANLREAVWAATAVEDQGALDTLFPSGYEGLIAETFYNRTRILQVIGGISEADWAARKAMNITGPMPAFRIRGNRMLFSPIGILGEIYAVEYFSSYFVQNDDATPAPTVFKKYWTKDTDVCTLGDSIPIAYLTWAWLHKKGLSYAEEFRAYEKLLAVKSMRDKRPQALNMGGGPKSMGPGIFVSPGSWPVSNS